MIQTPKTFYIPFVRLIFSLAIVTLLIGCGAGSGQGLDENGNLLGSGGGGGGGTGTGASGNPDATLSWIQGNVLTPICSVCHGGAAPMFDLNWSSTTNTCANVGRASGWEPTMMEIDSGNPDASYMIWKLENGGPGGETIQGVQMPMSQPALPPATIQNIRDWISDGTIGCSAPQSSGVLNSAATGIIEVDSADSQSDLTYAEGSWMQVWNESLRVCTACHSLTPSSPRCSIDFECPPNGVVLTADNYFGVVDGNTVAPFDLVRSNLWIRVIEEDPAKRMPLGFDALTQTQLDIIQSWIEQGAPYCPENMICP